MSGTKHDWSINEHHRPGTVWWVDDGPEILAECANERHARRILACLKACESLPTEALESGALAEALDLLHEGYVDDETCDGSEEECPGCRVVRLLRRLGRMA